VILKENLLFLYHLFQLDCFHYQLVLLRLRRLRLRLTHFQENLLESRLDFRIELN
jgi:hypothetical protein